MHSKYGKHNNFRQHNQMQKRTANTNDTSKRSNALQKQINTYGKHKQTLQTAQANLETHFIQEKKTR